MSNESYRLSDVVGNRGTAYYGSEEMIVDSRARVTPAEMVERKLVTMLRTTPMSVSHRQTAARTR